MYYGVAMNQTDLYTKYKYLNISQGQLTINSKNKDQLASGLGVWKPDNQKNVETGLFIAYYACIKIFCIYLTGFLVTATDPNENHVSGAHIDFVQRGENPTTRQPVFVVYTDQGIARIV